MINLIPDHIKTNNRYAVKNVRLLRYTFVSIATIVAIGIITALGSLGMQKKQDDLQKEIDSQNQSLSTYKPLEAQGKQLSDQLSTVNTLLNRQVSFSTLLPELAKIMPKGAILKQLNLSASDILPAGSTTPAPGSSPASQQQKPFIIQAAVTDRAVAAVLLENIKASKELFTDADLVNISQSTKGLSNDANSLDSTTVKYPYQVTINAYLKKLNPQQTKTTGAAQ